MYALKRIKDGNFVSLPGSKDSYTTDLLKAQTFPTREQAQASACVENEYIVDIDRLLKSR